jgi:L-ascorbate metabolism protein UlaG (beta-lactamase superfamily)
VIEPALADQAFLADVAAATDSDRLYLWWLGQSGFLIKHAGRHLLIDPYLSDSLTRKYAGSARPHVRMSRRVVDPARLDFVDVVASTHGHTDHLDGETLAPILAAGAALVSPAANRALALERTGREPDVGLSWGERATVGGFELEAVPAAHPQLAPQYSGYVVRCAAGSVYHSGDTEVYAGMAERVGAVDLALLPINGALANMSGVEAARLARALPAGLAIPCHYDMFVFNTASPEGFSAACERLDQRFRVLRLGERLALPPATRA